VLDEVQRVPELMSYLQVEVDNRPEPGRFILTGSTHFALLESVSQSLAGRTAHSSRATGGRTSWNRFWRTSGSVSKRTCCCRRSGGRSTRTRKSTSDA